MEPVILASASPRRTELLDRLGVPHITKPQDTDEKFDSSDCLQNALRLAEEKAESCLREVPDAKWIIAADTIICFKGKKIGKPGDIDSARSILSDFSGRTHNVISAVSLIAEGGKSRLSGSERTKVKFRKLSQSEIDWYLACGEWADAAGAYKIQGKGDFLIQGIRGSVSNVMGLSIPLIYGMLKSLGYNFSA